MRYSTQKHVMKLFIHLIFISLLFCGNKAAIGQTPNWEINPHNFSQNMTGIIRVKMDSVYFNAMTTKIAVFVGSEIRGVVNSATLLGGQAYFPITIYSNLNSGEILTFKVFEAANEVVYMADETAVFNRGVILGNVLNPFILTIHPVCTAPLITCPPSVTINSLPARCGNYFDYSPKISGFPAPALSHHLADATTGNGPGTSHGVFFNKGITSVKLVVDNNCKPKDSCTFQITVEGGPVQNTRTGTYYCDLGLALSAPGIIDNDTFLVESGIYNLPCFTVFKSICLRTKGGDVTLQCINMNGFGKTLSLFGNFNLPSLTLTNGKIINHGSILKVDNLIGGTNLNYIVLLQGGKLCRPVNKNTLVNFPIGTLVSLTDVNISGNANHVDDLICIGVEDKKSMADFTSPTPYGSRFIPYEWSVSEAIQGGSDVNMAFHFPSDPNNVKGGSSVVVGHNNGMWMTQNTSIFGNGPFTTGTVGPYNNFSPFGVFGCNPVCDFTGPASVDVNESNVYSAVDSNMSSYLWSISGDAKIIGSDTDKMVTVLSDSYPVCSGSYTLTLLVTDGNGAGCSKICNQEIFVNDKTKPVLTGITFQGTIGNIGCKATALSAAPFNMSDAIQGFTDNGNGPLTAQYVSYDINGTDCEWAITYTFEVSDACGNKTSGFSYTNYGKDLAPPNFTSCPGNMELVALGNDCGRMVTYSVTAQDLCGGTINLLQIDGSGYSSGSFFPLGTTQQKYEAIDECGNKETCQFEITIREEIKPQLVCPIVHDIQLNPGECGRIVQFNDPYATDNCDLSPEVFKTDTTGLISGAYFPKGSYCLSYQAVDSSGNTNECSFCFNIKAYPNPTGILACNDQIQISLDDSCRATISAEIVLKGGPYSCFEDYQVEVRSFTNGAILDRNPMLSGSQIDHRDIGKLLIITVIDLRSGNSCWGKALVEDKLPPTLICPRDTVVTCTSATIPGFTGLPYVYESCGNYILNYMDEIQKGNCTDGIEYWIKRIWTARDNSGNMSSCTQHITVAFLDIDKIEMPSDYNGFATPKGKHALRCDEKYNPLFDLSNHLRPSAECIDDNLLDHAEYIHSGRRIPKKLGWNVIKTGSYAGHPSPEPSFYPVHKDSMQCWNSNEIVMWEGTGLPKIEGCTNFAMSYEDIVVKTSKTGCDAGPVGCYKLLRTWTILDWCTRKIRTFQQIIKVVDPEGPVILLPDTIELIANPGLCETQWEIKDLELRDNCSIDINYTVQVIYGTVLGNSTSGYIVTGIPVGEQYVTVIAEDCCGNITEKKILLRVSDLTAPFAVCQGKVITSIVGNSSSSENFSIIKSSSFDNGSFDNCRAKVFYKAIRMDELQGTVNGSNKQPEVCDNINGDDNKKENGSQSYFDDDVKFCCRDVNVTRTVVFRVFDVDPGAGPVYPERMNAGGDLFGHFSDCMVEVEVQDKSIPVVVAPPDIVVSCSYWFDVNNLTNPFDSTFGKVVTDVAWRKKVVTKDVVCSYFCKKNNITGYPGYQAGFPLQSQPANNKACDYYKNLFDAGNPDKIYDLDWGYDGYILSTCSALPSIQVKDLRVCGQGRILRELTAKGPNGVTVSAIQTIWVVDCNPFYVNRTNFCDPDDDISWPDCQVAGTYIYGCGANISPDNPRLGRPEFINTSQHNCTLITIEYFDDLFSIEKDACFKILRKWVVIDWCQFDPNINPDDGKWEFTQIIHVTDLEAPNVSCHIGDCEPALFNLNLQSCVGHINLTVSATDSCTMQDALLTEYKIDLFNNGTYDYHVGKLTWKEYTRGIKPMVTNNSAADNPNNPFDASGIYPIGRHRICWTVEDGCGNLGQCCSLFEIVDCKAPTPFCLTGIITVPMPTSGCVDIWAKDLNLSSFDNCTPPTKLKYYFDGDPNKKSIRVCCEDFVRNQKADELIVNVQMWVEDEEGNKDYCSTIVIVQDNQNVCPDQSGFKTSNIYGLVKTENGELTAKADIELYNNNSLQRYMTTGNAGYYFFGDLNMNTPYVIKSKRNDDAINGVTTADIVKISRHILGIEELNSPYKLIAADVNGSNTISAVDISEIRKLILGIKTSFSKTSSWLILSSDYVFADPKKPWNFLSEANVITTNESNQANFIAIKKGDVNNSANAGYLKNNSNTRNSNTLKMIIDETSLIPGEINAIDVKASNFIDITGFQLTLKFDTRSLNFRGIERGALNLDASNFGTHRTEDGFLTMSWNSEQGLNFTENDVLFTLKFTANAGGSIDKLLAITSEITPAEAYHSDLLTSDLKLHFRAENSVEGGMLELYQNIPNPFEKETAINFRIGKEETVTLNIYNATGNKIYSYKMEAKKGLNTINIKPEYLKGPGMYFYQLDTGNEIATRRMVM
jgi:hypothetical protein